MDLRKQLSSYIALNNYVEAIRENTSSVVLTDAIHNSLIDLQLKGSEVKNKPETFLDSVIAKGGTEQRNIPDGYIERQFIYMMDGSYLLTDIVPTYDCKIEMDFATTSVPSASATFFGGRSGDSFGDGLQLAKPANGKFIVDAFNGTRYVSNVAPASNTRYKFTFNNQVATLESAGSALFTNTFTGTGATGGAIAINALNTNGTITGNAAGIYLYSFKAWNAQGELVMNLVPAVQKGTVPVVGFYDTVSGTFKTATAGTFTAGPTAVPTPDTPMDIVSNNGVLKARHQSGLPLGYTLVDGITANGTQYIDTGIKIASTDTVETEFKISTLTDYGAVYGIYATGESSAFYANQTYYSYDKSNNKVNTNVAVDNQWHTVVHDFVNGTLQLDDTTVTFTPFVFANANNNGLFTRFYNGSYGYFLKGSVKSHKITRNGTVIFNAVSVQRDSDSALGMYDFVSGTFFTNQGTGTFTAGNPVSDPVEIYTDGTVETIEDTIGNTATAEMLLKVGNYQDVQSILDGVVTRNVGVKVLDGTENWTKGTTQVANYSFWTDDASFAILTDRTILCTHFQSSQTLPPATQANRNNKIWRGTSDIAGTQASICIGYNFDGTVEEFKQFLADQYAAGTPVIVIYPLATPTTETVSSQKLLKNPVTVTEASIDNLEVTTTETEHTVPTPDYPLDIVCNNGVLRVGPNNSVIVEGTPETVTITGKNLFDITKDTTGKFIDEDGSMNIEPYSCYSDLIPVKEGESYTYSGICNVGSTAVANNKRIHGYVNGVWNRQIAVTTIGKNTSFYTTFTIPTGINGIRISHWTDDTYTQVEESSRPTKYEEYYKTSFASEDLLKLGDYQDVQDVINGIKSKKIGIKVFDGTEGWIKTATYTNLYEMSIKNDGALYSNIMFALTSTHLIGTAEINTNMPDNSIKLTTRGVDRTDPLIFIKTSQGNDTLAGFKQFLADQYTLGTPVIVVYPLADTVEETVESRDVFITSGTNTIERNSEYVSSGDITVGYKKLR